MKQIIIKHIIQLNQENSLHQYKKRDTRILKSQRLKEIVEISQSMLKGDYEKLRTNRMISVENYKMAAILTHTDIKEEDLPKGDEINMCKAMDQLFQRFENQGIEKGETIGIEKTLKELLKVKLGTLSNPLEEQLTTTSLEKLNERVCQEKCVSNLNITKK